MSLYWWNFDYVLQNWFELVELLYLLVRGVGGGLLIGS